MVYINFRDFIKQNKIVVITFIALILLFGFLIGRKIFLNNPNNVDKFTSYGSATNDDSIKKVNKSSNLGKKLPNAEEIMSSFNKEHTKELELIESTDIDDFVLATYGEDVYNLYIEGLIPSTQLSEQDNLLILLTGNFFLDNNDTYFGVNLVPNTYNYITSLGTELIATSSNSSRTGWNYDLPEESEFNNTTTTISTGSFFVQGGFIQNYTQLSSNDAQALTGEDYPTFEDISEDDADIDAKIDQRYAEYLKEKISNKYVLTLPIILKKDMKVSEIKKELEKIQFNEKSLTVITNSGSEIDNQASFSNFYALSSQNDYKISGLSSINVSFLIDENATMYPEINYLMYDKKQIAYSNEKPENTMTTSTIFSNYQKEVE